MLKRSTEQCSSLAKTWYYFGNWAYKWGRKCLDNAEQSLSPEEIQQIEGFLPNGKLEYFFSETSRLYNYEHHNLQVLQEGLC